jgi:hypothetical protein
LYTNQVLAFRLFVVDHSWALVWAVLLALNNMSVVQYAKVVFEAAKNPSVLSRQITWLISCAAHTMHRMTATLKEADIDDSQREFAAQCFSLLLNSTTLDEASNHYLAICTVFLSPIINPSVHSAKQSIDLSLGSITRKYIKPYQDEPDALETTKSSLDDDETVETETSDAAIKATIKSQSPFTAHFKVYTNVLAFVVSSSGLFIELLYLLSRKSNCKLRSCVRVAKAKQICTSCHKS